MKDLNYNGQVGLLKQIFFPKVSPGNESSYEFHRELMNIILMSKLKIPELSKLDIHNFIDQKKRTLEYAALIEILFTIFLDSKKDESAIVKESAERKKKVLRCKFKLDDNNLPIKGETASMTYEELASVTLKADGSGNIEQVNARRLVEYGGHDIQNAFYRKTKQAPR